MLHNTSNGSSFWMGLSLQAIAIFFFYRFLLQRTDFDVPKFPGNLKHKDLLGQVVSSQLCVGEDKEDNTGDPETE